MNLKPQKWMRSEIGGWRWSPCHRLDLLVLSALVYGRRALLLLAIAWHRAVDASGR